MSTQPGWIASGNAAACVRLSGGHAEKQRTIDAYRSNQHVDVEIHSADGQVYRAHGIVLMAGSDYFAAALRGGWADATGPHALAAVPAPALAACVEWIYTGACVAAGDDALRAVLEAAVFLQIAPLVDEAVRVLRRRLGPSLCLCNTPSRSYFSAVEYY